MQWKVEIVVFSHIAGKIENIKCDSYQINLAGSFSYVKAIIGDKVVNVIPTNRIKQININEVNITE